MPAEPHSAPGFPLDRGATSYFGNAEQTHGSRTDGPAARDAVTKRKRNRRLTVGTDRHHAGVDRSAKSRSVVRFRYEVQVQILLLAPTLYG